MDILTSHADLFLSHTCMALEFESFMFLSFFCWLALSDFMISAVELEVHDLGIESWGMFIIGYFLFAMASPCCCCCCWQYWLLAVGWWMPQRAIAGSPSLLIVSMCHLTFLKNWWVKSMLILLQRNQAYLLEDVGKGIRIARGWKSHAIPWSIFLDSGEECYIVKK